MQDLQKENPRPHAHRVLNYCNAYAHRLHAGAAARAAVSSARSTPRRQTGQDPRLRSHGAAQRRWSRWPQGSAATFRERVEADRARAVSPGAAAGSVSTTRAAAGHAATAFCSNWRRQSVGGGAAAGAVSSSPAGPT